MNGAEKQAQFKARMREKGLAQVTEWIPETKKPLFREMAAAWRAGQDPGNIITGNHSPEPSDDAFKAKVAIEVEKEMEQEEKRAMDKALLWLDGLEPDELLEHLPGGHETVRALLDWLSPADLEALHNAIVGTAANIQEFNRIMETPQ